MMFSRILEIEYLNFLTKNKKDTKPMKSKMLSVNFLLILVYLSEEDIIGFLDATSL